MVRDMKWWAIAAAVVVAAATRARVFIVFESQPCVRDRQPARTWDSQGPP